MSISWVAMALMWHLYNESDDSRNGRHILFHIICNHISALKLDNLLCLGHWWYIIVFGSVYVKYNCKSTINLLLLTVYNLFTSLLLWSHKRARNFVILPERKWWTINYWPLPGHTVSYETTWSVCSGLWRHESSKPAHRVYIDIPNGLQTHKINEMVGLVFPVSKRT